MTKVNCPVVLATLELMVKHLGKVAVAIAVSVLKLLGKVADASANNKMDRVNLGLMFGQVENNFLEQASNNLFLIIQTLLWPDPSLTLGLEYIAGIVRFQVGRY